MSRRRFLTMIGLMVAITMGDFRTPPLAAASIASDGRGFRIMMILWRGETPVERGFREHLAARGVTVEFLVRDLARDIGRLPAVLAEAERLRPDLVYTWGTGITLGTVGRWNAPDRTAYITDLPVVFAMVSAPRQTGIEPPPGAPPRPNVTGVSHIAPLPAQINAIRAYLPLSRLGIVYNAGEPNSVANVEDLRALAPKMGFSLLEAPVPPDANGAPDPASLPGLVSRLAKQGAQILYIGPDTFIGNHRDELTAAGVAHGIPCFTATELEIRESDAMIGLVSPYEAVGRLAAEKARMILVEGKPPSALPIETLEHFSYIIRLPVALRLRLYPPLPLLDYAEVIR
ncbi:MAG: ABC transporter substrate-binding protein [Rhodospirillales bacterium]|nr:ABC transporter substrate-binding protein [Rhodospirillales bacterium]